MERKESYKNILPHFQQPGQAYFVTWILKGAIPYKALNRYTQKLSTLKTQIEFSKSQNQEQRVIDDLILQFNLTRKKYIKAYDDLLVTNGKSDIDLTKPGNLKILVDTIRFWEGKRLKSYACCVMTNHVHWVFELLYTDEKGNPVYLQDILQSIKRHSAREINKLEGKYGSLWQKESFDTTIRDQKHLFLAVEYTLNNPVVAGLAPNRNSWPGNFLFNNY